MIWRKHLSLWIVGFGVFGYLLAVLMTGLVGLEASSTQGLFEVMTVIKQLFFSALKMLITPIILFSLLNGMLQISEVSHLGKLGKHTLIYYLSTTTIAILLGLSVVVFFRPWEAEPIDKTQVESLMQAPKNSISQSEATALKVFNKMTQQVLVNPLEAFTSNNILGLVFWSFLIGLAFISLGQVDPVIKNFIAEANRIMGKILSWVIQLAPFGVMAISFTFYFLYQGAVLWQLLSFMLTVFVVTMIHGVIVLPTLLKLFTPIGFFEFFKKSMKPLLLAFSTSSSAATLPVSMQTAQQEFSVRDEVSAFILPLGATMNMDGTALFEGIAAVFLAYLFGIDLGTVALISVFFMAVISSIGAPGMPSGSMSGMQMVLIAAGIPLEGIGLLLLIERPLDTFRTAVNVQGDLIGAIIINQTTKSS